MAIAREMPPVVLSSDSPYVSTSSGYITSPRAVAEIKAKAKKAQEAHVTEAIDYASRQAVADAFHELWYPRQQVWWMGAEMQKCPLDLFMYQEIIYECRPDLIVECGTWKGGSALYLAHLCDILHRGQIITIDINRWLGFPIHPRINYLTGSSVDPNVVAQVKAVAQSFRNVMVILDSDHTKEHVLGELELYSEIVSPRQYLIVEDTNIHGHPVRDDLPPGPHEAIEAWLPKHDEFVRDAACERFLMTFNPGGYLRRMK